MGVYMYSIAFLMLILEIDFFIFLKYDICCDADFITESIWLVNLLLDDKYNKVFMIVYNFQNGIIHNKFKIVIYKGI